MSSFIIIQGWCLSCLGQLLLWNAISIMVLAPTQCPSIHRLDQWLSTFWLVSIYKIKSILINIPGLFKLFGFFRISPFSPIDKSIVNTSEQKRQLERTIIEIIILQNKYFPKFSVLLAVTLLLMTYFTTNHQTAWSQ